MNFPGVEGCGATLHTFSTMGDHCRRPHVVGFEESDKNLNASKTRIARLTSRPNMLIVIITVIE